MRKSLYAQPRPRSVRADAQAERSPHSAHSHPVDSLMSRLEQSRLWRRTFPKVGKLDSIVYCSKHATR